MAPQSSVRLPSLFTIEETAERLKVSTRTVRRLITQRALAAYRVGHGVRISEDDLMAYLNTCR